MTHVLGSQVLNVRLDSVLHPATITPHGRHWDSVSGHCGAVDFIGAPALDRFWLVVQVAHEAPQSFEVNALFGPALATKSFIVVALIGFKSFG